jgi:hypothetical protein
MLEWRRAPFTRRGGGSSAGEDLSMFRRSTHGRRSEETFSRGKGVEMARKNRKQVIGGDGAPLRPVVTEDVAAHPRGRPAEGPVALETTGVESTPSRREVSVEEARRRFGGVDFPASLVGMLTALALLTLLGGLVGAAVGAIGYQSGLDGNEQELSLGGLAGGVVALFIAYFVGGWAAARIARYDGVRNGVMTGVWTLLLAAILATLGATLGSEYDVLSRVDLPNWFSRDALTAGAIVSGVVAVIAMLGGGALGGSRGDRYHRRADAAILDTRGGGLNGAAR